MTHEELSILLRALGIAEMQINKQRVDYINTLVNVRGNDNPSGTRKEVDHMMELSNRIADLLTAVKDGRKDV